MPRPPTLVPSANNRPIIELGDGWRLWPGQRATVGPRRGEPTKWTDTWRVEILVSPKDAYPLWQPYPVHLPEHSELRATECFDEVIDAMRAIAHQKTLKGAPKPANYLIKTT